MIIDKLLQVSDKQAVTSGDAPSTHVIDFGQENPNTGMDGRTKMVITINESFTSSSSTARLRFVIQDSADNVAFNDAASSGTIAKENLGAGVQIVIPMPTKLRRYCRLYYRRESGNFDAGKFSAQIVTGIQQNDPYPDSPRIA